MKTPRIRLAILFSLLTTGSLLVADPAPVTDYHHWAPTPPMGWNSWDCFGTTVTEAQTRQQADFMAAKLKSHGWQYIVVDIQWYQPTATVIATSFHYLGIPRPLPMPGVLFNCHTGPSIMWGAVECFGSEGGGGCGATRNTGRIGFPFPSRW